MRLLKMLTLIRTKSSVKANQKQIATLECLKISKLHSVTTIEDSNTNRGMITRIRNLIVWFPSQENHTGNYRPPKGGYKIKKRKGLITPVEGIKLLMSMKS